MIEDLPPAPVRSLPDVLTFPDHAAWLDGRRAGIGGSDVGAILRADGAFGNPWKVYNSKVSAAERRSNADTRRGNAFEAAVIETYAGETGATIVRPKVPTIYRHPVHPWALASVDAWTADGGIVEAKTDRDGRGWGPSQEIPAWVDGCEDIVRVSYALQCYWYLEVTGAPWCDLVVLLPRFEIATYRIHRDEDFQGDLLAAVGDWRAKHLLAGNPPPIDGSADCTEGQRRRFPAPTDKTPVPADPDAAELIAEYAAAKARADVAESDVAELKNRLLGALGSRYGLTAPAGKVLQIRSDGRETIDGAALAREYPDAYLACRRKGAPFVSVKFTAAKIKE